MYHRSSQDYERTYNSINSATAEIRNAERMADVSRNVSDIRSEFLELKIMVRAMYKIMLEQGIDPDLINAKMDEIMEDPDIFMPYTKASKPCPKCGRTVTDNGKTPLTGTCLYCGTVVKFPPHFDFGNSDAEKTEDANSEAGNTDAGFMDDVNRGTGNFYSENMESEDINAGYPGAGNIESGFNEPGF